MNDLLRCIDIIINHVFLIDKMRLLREKEEERRGGGVYVYICGGETSILCFLNCILVLYAESHHAFISRHNT